MLKTRFLLLLCLCYPALVLAAKPAAEMVSVNESFARATLPGMPMAAVFMKLHNRSAQEYLLTAASSPSAKSTEIHGHVMENGMMRMRPMAHVHIPENGDKVLKPGGLHIMLIGIHKPLKEGDTLPLKLIYADGSAQDLSVPVKSRTADFN